MQTLRFPSFTDLDKYFQKKGWQTLVTAYMKDISGLESRSYSLKDKSTGTGYTCQANEVNLHFFAVVDAIITENKGQDINNKHCTYHTWSPYNGFTETYEYCVKCDTKREWKPGPER